MNEHYRLSQQPHLLDLPVAVRNIIFRYTLIEDGPITLSATSPAPPGLLRTCTLIRVESMYLYYMENYFVLNIVDYNVEAVLLSYKVHQKYSKERANYQVQSADRSVTCMELTGNMHIQLLGKPSWHNLVQWCKAVYDDRVFTLSVHPNCTNEDEIAVAAIHTALCEMHDLPWESIKPALEGFRKLMVLRDPAWAT